MLLCNAPAGSLAPGTFALSQAQHLGCRQPPVILALAAAKGAGRRQGLATACDDSPEGDDSPDVNNSPDGNSPDVYNSPDGNYSPALPMPRVKGCFAWGPLPRCLPLPQNLSSCRKRRSCPGAQPPGLFAVPTARPRPPPSSHPARNTRAVARDPAKASPVLIGGGVGC